MSKQDLVEVEIIEDGDNDEFEYIIPVKNTNNINEFVLVENIKKSRKPRVVNVLKTCYYEDSNIYEIGIDEAGRGPLFGRVYAGAVVLPKNVELFNHSLMKDSKKFTSKKKIDEVAEYIKENAIAWAVAYEDEKVIDDINILQATQSAMHKAILEVKKQMHSKNIISNNDNDNNSLFLLVDGNYFKPVTIMNTKTNKFESIKFTTVEGGDNKYTAIAAASILAKVERDNYIDELCKNNPELVTNYGIDTNKGYGAKKHIEGIKQHGISIWHRRTFGICKDFA